MTGERDETSAPAGRRRYATARGRRERYTWTPIKASRAPEKESVMKRLEGIVELQTAEMERVEGGDTCVMHIFIDYDGDGQVDELWIIYYEC
jgi:hypothetical protein